MIGGPSDLVVEPNIVRAASAPREAAPPRPPAATDTLPRAVPLGEGTMWPLQPEPAPVAREPVLREPPPREPAMREPPPPREPMIREPVMREPPPRPQRAAAPPPVPEEQWPEEPEPPPPPPQRDRRPRAPDPLTGLAEELSRAPVQPDAGGGDAREARQPRREPRPTRPQPQPAPPAPAPTLEQQFNSAADQNLAEMAQRLEAALRRPGKTEDPRFAEPAPRAEPAAAGPEDYPAPPPARAPGTAEARPPRTEPRPARTESKPAAGKSLYDSLEQEMASLLGRPDKKT
jgi:hypothetical protein